MFEKPLPHILVYLLAGIFIIHTLALYFFWYWKIPWLDMPVHFAVGFWVGGTLVWVFAYWKGILRYIIQDKKFLNIITVVAGVMIVGLLWEVFEYTIDHFAGRTDYDIIDTASDLFFDFIGGTIAGLYFIKNVNNKIFITTKNGN